MKNSWRIEGDTLYAESLGERFDYWASEDWRSGIRRAVLAEGIAAIPDGCFQYFDGLEEVVLPASLKEIGASAFADCTRLRDPVLPEGTSVIGDGAFQGDFSIRRLVLPASLTRIGENALYFGDESRLLSVEVTPGNPVFASENGVLFTRDRARLLKYPSAKRAREYDVPETVKCIADAAFAHSRYLHRISLPEGLETLESGAFSFCTHLEELTVPESVTGIPSYAFFCCERLKKLILPKSAEYLGYESICNCLSLEVTLPEGIKQLDYAAVGCNPRLRELVVPEGVTELSNLPHSLTEIWDNAFRRCTKLKEIVIPKNVRYIDDEAFIGCGKLRRVILRSALIGDDDWLPEELRGRVEVIREG